MESVLSNISDLTISQHTTATHTEADETTTTIGPGDSPFIKVFDEGCQKLTSRATPLPPARQQSILKLSASGGHLESFEEAGDSNSHNNNEDKPSASSMQQPQPQSQSAVVMPRPRNQRMSSDRRMSSARRMNAPIPQRQASVTCLGNGGKDASHHHHHHIAKEKSLRSLFRQPSCGTFAEYSYNGDNSTLGLESSFGSLESHMDCSTIMDEVDEFHHFHDDDNEEEDEETEIDDSWDHSARDESSECLSMSSHVTNTLVQHQGQALTLPTIVPSMVMPSHNQQRNMMMMLGKRASSGDMRMTHTGKGASSPLSVSGHQRINTLLVQKASAQHIALRRKWAEQTSASARYLSVHKEEQEKTCFSSETNTTASSSDCTEEESNICAGAGTEFEALISSSSKANDIVHDKAVLKDDGLVVVDQDDDQTLGDEEEDDDFLVADSFCCRLTACTTRWFSSRGKTS